MQVRCESKRFFFCCTIFLVLIFLHSINGLKYYKEKPFFVKTCKLFDTNTNQCFTNSMRTVFKQFFIGIPEILETRGSLDPYHLDDFSFHEHSNLVDLDGDFTSATVSGFSKMSLEEIRLNKTTLSGISRIVVPRSDFDCKYKLNGRVLLVPFNCSGYMNGFSDNLIAYVNTYKQLYKKDGFIFINITKVDVKLEASKMTVNYDNFFGDVQVPEVNKIFNDLLNDNWQEFYEAVQPLVENLFSKLYLNFLQTFFEIIPANFFFEDLPTEGNLYKKSNANN